ncbi:hypothetical protein CYR55_08095 [Chimaeribacter californicus]|uniref:Glycoprotein-polysaccharide metabolism protein n=1 Tax=Chimaeribacter californicus TaxID=2060067 RepID=A0A2N5E9Y8_9GAMM|nr:YbaY family lipoprotein [Chimaeribacter californicus]PLR38702.1 hypothetical protein CYR55_08095 [Chimaeribacter californicus]
MKLWQIVGGTALSLTLAGCASHSAPPPSPPPGNGAPSTAAIQQPSVNGTINISQRVALPPDAVLTVTLSDASTSDAPSKVIAQSVARTEGKQAPFPFVLPYNPRDIKPDAHVILSAAITHNNGQMLFMTDTIQEVINNGKADQVDLKLVPLASVPVTTKPSTLGPLDTSPNNPVPSTLNPAPSPMP